MLRPPSLSQFDELKMHYACNDDDQWRNCGGGQEGALNYNILIKLNKSY
jgi:hypothetical protein